MGTGCGSNAILAASRSQDVVGVDRPGPPRYLERLIDANGFGRELLATRDLEKDDLTVTYLTWRLVPS